MVPSPGVSQFTVGAIFLGQSPEIFADAAPSTEDETRTPARKKQESQDIKSPLSAKADVQLLYR
jgi:hypothetical protein